MKVRDPDNIHFHDQFIDGNALINDNYQPVLHDKKPVRGLDTETYRGKANLIADSTNLKESYLLINCFEDVAEYLTEYCRVGTHNFFFNTSYDKDGIIKWLPDKCIEFLKCNNHISYKNYHLQLIGKQAFKICRLSEKGKLINNVVYSDIARFWKEGSLVDTVKNVLERDYVKRLDVGEGLPSHLISSDYIKYCIEDARQVRDLSNHLNDLASEYFNIKDYYSHATLSKEYMKSQRPLYQMKKMSVLQKMAFKSFSGGRFEIFFSGYQPEVHMTDINSAYPAQLKDLYLPKGSHIYNHEYEPESLYSYFECSVRTRCDHRFSPLKYPRTGDVIYPTGRVKTCFLSKIEFETLVKQDADIKIKRAVHIFNSDPELWVVGIEDLYKERRRLKSNKDKREFILKVVLNSLYGITIQLTKKHEKVDSFTVSEELDINNDLFGKWFYKARWYAGKWFNPVIAAECSSRVRCKLFNDFYKREDDLVMIATDSVALNRKIGFKSSDVLGGYGHYPEMSGVVLANGIYQFEDGEGNTTIRNRGIIYDKEKGEKTDIKGLLEANRGKKLLELTKTRPKSLKEGLPRSCVGQNPYDLINIFLPYTKTLQPNIDKKRDWIGRFDTFGDVLDCTLDSNPLNLRRG